jgi:hypothetical protein
LRFLTSFEDKVDGEPVGRLGFEFDPELEVRDDVLDRPEENSTRYCLIVVGRDVRVSVRAEREGRVQP